MTQSSPVPQSSRFETFRGFLRAAGQYRRFFGKGDWDASLALIERAQQGPDDLAIAYLDERHTWREVNERANQYAHFFEERGIGRGDVVALMMDNRPDFLFAVHGLAKLEAVAALINTNLSGAPLAHAIRVAGARQVLCGSEHQSRVEAVESELAGLEFPRDLVVQDEEGNAPQACNAAVAGMSTAEPPAPQQRNVNGLFCYIYTSGTTGLPKAAIISHKRELGAGSGFAHLMLRTRPGNITYVPLPLYHSSAMFLGWGSALTSGAAIALRRKFSASNFFTDVRKFEADAFIYIGELCRYLLNTPPQEGERDHKLRVAVGNGLRPDIWQSFQERFNIPLVREFYGATEGNTAIMNLAGRPGMIGRKGMGQALVRCDQETGEVIRNAQGFCDPVAVGEVGLLLGKLNKLTGYDGYVDKEASNKKLMRDVFKKGDQYFNTGDLIQLHEDRWLSFADRVGDTFRWKGENVSTNEVAEVLNGAKGVLESNVYGVEIPNAEGRAGMAALNISAEFDLEEFGRYVQENLPGYQQPRFVRILKDAMQTTGTLKHQKVQYRKEGFDPTQVKDPLYFLQDERYVPLDAELLRAIETGEIKL